jgi:hypothetical protein
MSVFMGGSAYNMVRDIADGYVIISDRTFRNYGPADFAGFSFEAARLLQEIRSNQPPLSDTEAVQKRHRKMQRLQQAITIASSVQSRRA